MIASFSKLSFVADIILGRKPHTLREDKNERWKVGMDMDLWFRNPRLKGKCKDGIDPFFFMKERLVKKERVTIVRDPKSKSGCKVLFERGEMADTWRLIYADGFNKASDFRAWFLPEGKEYWTGWILYWKDVPLYPVVKS